MFCVIIVKLLKLIVQSLIIPLDIFLCIITLLLRLNKILDSRISRTLANILFKYGSNYVMYFW